MNTTETTVEQKRFNMIEQQIRPWNVLDERVIDALFKLRRDQFVAHELKSLAFSDVELPIELDGNKTDQIMLSPKLEARLAQDLLLSPSESVLEIGTGSGFQAAILSHLCNQVFSIEIHSAIARQAQKNLKENQIDNVVIQVGDAHNSWGSSAYNAILLTGSVTTIPDALKYQLAVGGRLVIVVGVAPLMTVYRITRVSPAQFDTESLYETCIPPLVGTTVSHFKF